MNKKIEVVVNGTKDYYDSWRNLLGRILAIIPNLEYWSYDALRKLYTELLIDCAGIFNADLSRRRGSNKTIGRLLLYMPLTREGLLVRIYETILSSEKMGLMAGFGISNQFGDNLKGNPEKQSLRETESRRMGLW